ncbi:hypothetical protein SeMB42_g04603 [Synchytrium endobioticum]|uniref:Uncharacterized protein n=1 Tax=Synchytrium endobioticum TaxID=286115 RepID=A0A507CXE0_9FUNG|nr:hypothetical protein SeMB42_g04603 [Synchytrium endobioticum]
MHQLIYLFQHPDYLPPRQPKDYPKTEASAVLVIVTVAGVLVAVYFGISHLRLTTVGTLIAMSAGTGFLSTSVYFLGRLSPSR